MDSGVDILAEVALHLEQFAEEVRRATWEMQLLRDELNWQIYTARTCRSALSDALRA